MSSLIDNKLTQKYYVDGVQLPGRLGVQSNGKVLYLLTIKYQKKYLLKLTAIKRSHRPSHGGIVAMKLKIGIGFQQSKSKGDSELISTVSS
jgi:hypothetical protein